jgi:hypothetical protein
MKVEFKSIGGGVVAAAVIAMAVGAQAGTLWDNGVGVADGPGCSSNAETCNAGSPPTSYSGWTIYDDFQLGSASKVTGLTYESDFDYGGGSSAHYQSTNWSIWSTDPRIQANYDAGPAFQGTTVGSNTDIGGTYFTVTTITGLNIDLGAGNYWLGLQNNVDNGQITGYVATGTVRLETPFQWANNGQLLNVTLYGKPLPDASFTIQGVAVPEPATWAMMLIGFFGLGSLLRRRRSLAAAA